MNQNKHRSFYLVWNPSNARTPRRRHETELQAREEAERLARSNPSQEFYVLRAVTVSVLPRERVNTTMLPFDPSEEFQRDSTDRRVSEAQGPF